MLHTVWQQLGFMRQAMSVFYLLLRATKPREIPPVRAHNHCGPVVVRHALPACNVNAPVVCVSVLDNLNFDGSHPSDNLGCHWSQLCVYLKIVSR